MGHFPWAVARHPRRRGCRVASLGALALFLLLAGAGRAARAEEAVLLGTTAPGYRPGMVIAATAVLVLPDGASMTLLFRSGQMLRLRGPFTGSLERVQRPEDKLDAFTLADLFRLQGVDATVIGGTRTWRAGGPGIVRIDPRRSATYCLGRADPVRIGRPPDDGRAYRLQFRTGQRALAWPGNAEQIDWPDDVPIRDGDRFAFTANGVPQATIGLRRLDQDFVSETAWIAAGVLAGCQEQFDARLRQLARATIPPELWLTSTRGRSPSYRPGESIRLQAQADIDGFLYCLARSDDRSVVPILPRGGGAESAPLRAGVALSIPGGPSGPQLRAGVAGTTWITCWLTDRDRWPEWSHLVSGPLATDPDAVFSGFDGRPALKAELTLRVQ
ncbi:conserved protein of unknown function [Rhodovastum atsumiense]|uniref:DUF4384 domain-containing protein n=1 Tax=Rhodovastum atsumiense TaxID=504468 RepID=A0A5M6IQX9_9PROT|nr:DUF4384 domain-containing protein [Rhodovastum atsumiense]KAA5609875.1 DUF4384 domain-containing protein [Rhodovastum atsumiense]CAH2602424.1 conserved protein of unknown function [Rhodovastum atsumiense]